MDWLIKRDNQPFSNSIVGHAETKSAADDEASALNLRYQTTQYYTERFTPEKLNLGRFPNE